MSVIHKLKGEGAKCGAKPWRRYSGLHLTEDDARVTCKRCKGEVKSRYHNVELTENYLDKIFTYSFGYDMTINVFAKVIKQTAKTLLLKECSRHVADDDGRGAGKAWAGEVIPDGDEFRISKKVNTENPEMFTYWIGGGTRHSWHEWDGKAQYHNTWD